MSIPEEEAPPYLPMEGEEFSAFVERVRNSGLMTREEFAVFGARIAHYLAEGLEPEDAIDRAGEDHRANRPQ